MKNSLSLVAFIGVFGVLITMFLYFYVVSEHTDAGKFVKAAGKIKSVYSLDAIDIRVDLPEGKAMTIQYTTSLDSGLDTARQEQEMKEIGTMALSSIPAAARKKVETISIHRSEIHGSGCFRDEYTNDLVMENPARTEPQ